MCQPYIESATALLSDTIENISVVCYCQQESVGVHIFHAQHKASRSSFRGANTASVHVPEVGTSITVHCMTTHARIHTALQPLHSK